MHYIIGTRFNVPPVERGKTDPVTLQKNRLSKQFDEVGEYELYYIRRVDGGVEYTFISLESMNQVKKKFPTTKEADDLIASALMEDLPDYQEAYARTTD